MNPEVLKERTRVFAHQCIALCREIPRSVLGDHIKRQLIRSSTSIVANYRATALSQSRATFIAKMSIVIEETDESAYWLELVRDENLIKSEKTHNLIQEAKELTSIFIASRITALKHARIK